MSISATVIFDNGGLTTLQLTDSETGSKYAHCYDSAQRAAGDLRVALGEQDFSSWDGHEDDAADLAPTAEQIRNGGYRVVRFDSLDELRDFPASEIAQWGGNASEFACACA